MDNADAEAWTTDPPKGPAGRSSGVHRPLDAFRPAEDIAKTSGELSPAMQRWTAQTDTARHIEHLERRLASLKRTRSNGPASDGAQRNSRLSRRHSDSGEYCNVVSRRRASSPLASLHSVNEIQTPHLQYDADALAESEGEADDKEEDERPDESDTAGLLHNTEASSSSNYSRLRVTKHSSPNTVTRNVPHILSDSGHGGSTGASSHTSWQEPQSRESSRRIESRYADRSGSSPYARRPSILMPRPLRVPRNVEVSFDEGNSSIGRISFADNVRICGGIRSAEDEQRERSRRMSTRSITSTVTQSADTMFSATSPVFYHGVGMGRPSHMSVRQALPAYPVTINVRRGSVPNSRPGSFYGSDCDDASTACMHTSRASTPASLYAPLLLPSKTAPSPSRTFYLTFGGGTYRDLVRQQLERVEARKRAKRAKERKQWWANLCTCGLAGRRKKRQSSGSKDAADGVEAGVSNFNANSEAQDDTDGEGDEQEALLRDLDAQLTQQEAAEAAEAGHVLNGQKALQGTTARREYKSEARVIYGKAPWRWLRASWWGWWGLGCDH